MTWCGCCARSRIRPLASWVSALIILLPLALIIFGGIRRIAFVADIVVPIMAVGYIIMLVIVLAANLPNLPEMFGLIFRSAFGMDAVFGGMTGHAIAWGVRRAVFSNVAGAGEGTYSSAAAEVSHPAKQGLVQAFSVYIDTVLVCTATALMILSTRSYNVMAPGTETMLVEHLPGVKAGAAYTQQAISLVLPGVGAGFVAIAIFFFAFTCLMAYYYIAETTLVYLQEKLHFGVPDVLLKLVFLVVVALGCVQTADMMWGLGDIGFGTMCYLNLIVIVLLTRPASLALRDYERQKAAGVNPVFDAAACGMEDAVFWKKDGARR